MRLVPALILALMLAAPVLATPVLAQGYSEPARGSALRTDLLDAIRPIAEWQLGEPVEFVVIDLRATEDVAFASLMAQRPGGGVIDLSVTPMAERGDFDPEFGDGSASIQVLYQKSGRMWVPVNHAFSPSDVWWSWTAYCPIWGPVLPEMC